MPDHDLYQAVEERHGFSLPPEYRLMHERRFFLPDRDADFTAPGDHYLWLNDVEWYSLEEIAAFHFPELYEPHLAHLVPFAFTGGGDYWCWQTDHANARGTRVLLCPHDYVLATVYAPNFAAALYRQALEYAASPFDFEQHRAESRAYLQRWATDLADVFPPAWGQTLRGLALRPPVNWTAHSRVYQALLTPDERKQIEGRDLAWPELDSEIRWFD